MRTQYEDGYKKLIVWKNAARLRKIIFEMTQKFPKGEFRRISQMRDAARSVKQNIQEGSKKSIGEFLRYLNISRASLAELKGDVEDCYEDDILNENVFGLTIELICKTDYLFHRLTSALSNKRSTPIQPIRPIKLIRPILT